MHIGEAAEDLGLVPNTHVAVHNYLYLQLEGVQGLLALRKSHANTHIHINKYLSYEHTHIHISKY